MEFLRSFGPCLHALELNGLRPWSENREVIELGAAVQKPLISGGDRHAVEPNALLNLTNAATFDEFAEEVREGWSSVFVLRHYREQYTLRILHNMIDVLRTYERHANGWRLWSDRVFYLCHDGQTRSLTELFGERPPAAVALFVGAMKFASAPLVRRFLRGAFATRKRWRYERKARGFLYGQLSRGEWSGAHQPRICAFRPTAFAADVIGARGAPDRSVRRKVR